MKAVSIIISTLAAVATAAPASVEARNKNDFSKINNLQSFQSQQLNYIGGLNSIDFNLLAQLSNNNNLNIFALESLFGLQNSQLDIQALLEMQALVTFLSVAQTGALSAFDLSGLNIGSQLQLGLVNNALAGINIVDPLQAILGQQSNFATINTAVAALVPVNVAILKE